MLNSFSRRDGQLASFNEGHDVGVVGVGWIKRDSRLNTVNFNGDADVVVVHVGVVFSIGVHVHNSAEAAKAEREIPVVTEELYSCATVDDP